MPSPDLAPYFDHQNDGFAEQTGWAGADDGLLVRDLNNNGLIDSGAELFGSEAKLANGSKAAHGFAALDELDNNHDGKIDSADAAFATLKVWQDADGDGYTADGELLTLAEVGVQSIHVAYSTNTAVDANDTVDADAGNDVVFGGEGNDSLTGGLGDDLYLLERGGGQDTLNDNGGSDTLKLLGLNPGEFTVTRDAQNLYLALNDGSARARINGWFTNAANRIEQIQFGDGTVWSAADLEAHITVPSASAGNDVLYGTANADSINGLAGDDVLSGQLGNDTLEGGTGNDQLDGGQGNDLYLFARGDGQDSRFKAGLAGKTNFVTQVRLFGVVCPNTVAENQEKYLQAA